MSGDSDKHWPPNMGDPLMGASIEVAKIAAPIYAAMWAKHGEGTQAVELLGRAIAHARMLLIFATMELEPFDERKQ